MKKKVLTMVMVVAGIVSIGGIGFALSANQLTDKTSSNNDIMYAQVKTPETSKVTEEDNSRPTSNDQDLTIDEVYVDRNNNPKLQYQFVHFLSFLPKYQNLT